MAEISFYTRTITQYVVRTKDLVIPETGRHYSKYIYCNSKHQAAKSIAYQLALEDIPQGPGEAGYDEEDERYDRFWSLYNKYLEDIEAGNNPDFIQLRR